MSVTFEELLHPCHVKKVEIVTKRLTKILNKNLYFKMMFLLPSPLLLLKLGNNMSEVDYKNNIINV